MTTIWNGRWGVLDIWAVEQGIWDIKDQPETVAWGTDWMPRFFNQNSNSYGLRLGHSIFTSIEVYVGLGLGLGLRLRF